MSLPVNDSAIPIPKPRARYKQKQASTESGVGYDFPSSEVTGKQVSQGEEVGGNPAANPKILNGSHGGWMLASPALPDLREATNPTRGGVSDKFVWPDPNTSNYPDIKTLTAWAKDIGSDSSTDEYPMTPDSPKSNGDAEEPKIYPFIESSSSQIPSAPVGTISHGVVPLEPVQKSSIQNSPAKQKKPRAATIRVSRKKQASLPQTSELVHTESAVVRSSWLDVWKGRRHNVLWATLDGQLMSLWKKRTDKFTEYVFHVSSITNVRKHDRGRFSIYFRKKRFEFLAHNDDVQNGWVASLLASRGREALAPPEQHGPLTLKDPRTKLYAAIYGHNLWLHNSKEDFNLGLGITYITMSVVSVKQIGRHSFSLITPYKTFNFSAESSRDLVVWLDYLNKVIRSALSCSEVAHRLWANPWNKVCADCGCANPEWASINLLVVICEDCAGQHRAMGSNLSKVRSLKLDTKVWTEPLIELFVVYGNKVANDLWGHNIPAAEQIRTDATPNERGAFIQAKYCQGRYRKAHPLASSQRELNQRLFEVVSGPDVGETLSLLCSGARVHPRDLQGPSPILLAEKAGQAMQTELLRHNEFVETPNFVQHDSSREQTGLEELHGKLQDERFLFSLENESAACDVLDLREVISIFDLSAGSTFEFEMLTLTDKLICNSDARDVLLSHMLHIMRVVIPGTVLDEELDEVFAVSRMLLRNGGDLQHSEVWASLRAGEMLIFPTQPQNSPKTMLLLNPETRYNLDMSQNTVELHTPERTVYMQFEREQSCSSWHALLQRAVSTKRRTHPSLYQLPGSANGKVPAVLDRCLSHINQHGLKVEGLYRRCGMATKINEILEGLHASPHDVILETDELAVLDIAGAMKQFLRKELEVIPQTQREHWKAAAALPEEALRLQAYRRLVRQLHPDNQVTLATLCGHLYVVQLYSQENRMTAQNLALVFVPGLFQELAMSTDMVRLTRELIIHHTLVFLSKEQETDMEEEEIITCF